MDTPRNAAISYPKSGATWVRFLIGTYVQLLLSHPRIFLFDGDRAEEDALSQLSVTPLVFSHGCLTWEKQTWSELTHETTAASQMGMVLLLIRYPLDILLSHFMHHSYQRNHEQRRKFESLTHFIQDPVYGLDKLIAFYNLWAKALPEGKTHVLRYEDLTASPYSSATKCLRHLSIPVLEGPLKDAINGSSFEAMKAIEKSGNVPVYATSQLPIFGTGDPSNPNAYHVRSGTSGEYKRHLPKSVAEELESVVRDRLDPVYGYNDNFSRG